jgi:branched-chain amino acid transport system permease protein
MSTFLLFAVLGVGAGAAYAMLGLGIVLIQRGSGTVNFAQGGIAMFAALLFSQLVTAGVSKWLALVVVLLMAAALGVAWHYVVMRQLRHAPALARVIATLGLLSVLEGAALVCYGTGLRQAQGILPTSAVRIGGIAFGLDRIWLLGITVVLACALWALYRFSRFGVTTRAAAESERGAVLLGYSPDIIAAANWALGCALGALGGILIAPIVQLDVTTLTLLILPALGAALLGRFASFGVTAAAGIVMGSAQSVIGNYWTQPGVVIAIPFVAIIVAMVVTGRLIPQRGTLAAGREPLAPGRALPLKSWGVILVGVVLGAFLLGSTYQSALSTSLIFVCAALSVVVVTGYVGQISLMPMTFAGLGGLFTSKFAEGLGLPFPLPLIVAAACMIPVGILLGLPALRVRGMNLAVITIGAAISVSSVIFDNGAFTGGAAGGLVGTPSLFGFSLDPTLYPERFALLCAVVTALLVLGVANLRRAPSGLQMLSVRSNERAAAMCGTNVSATKLRAFALSAAVASVAGSLMSYQIGIVPFSSFDVFGSITLLSLAYIGGVATVNGALLAGLLANGGLLLLALQNLIPALPEYFELVSGLSLLLIVVFQPDGVVIALDQQRRAALRLISRRSYPLTESEASPPLTESVPRIRDKVVDVNRNSV